VRRGFAKKNPQEYDMLPEEVQEIKADPLVQENMNMLAVENIDQEDNLPVFSTEAENFKHANDVCEDGLPMGFDDVSEEEMEDYTIKKSDSIVVAAKIENEFSSLEVYVYEEQKCNLFVHHELTLSAFPLCLEWISIDPREFNAAAAKKGNFIAVGTFLPEIEIWNLDVINTIEPVMVLGGEDLAAQPKKKSKKFQLKPKLKAGSHTDAVMTLSSNRFRPNILASGSADNTIKMWDITSQSCLHTYTNHTDKVQTVKWNPSEESIVLSGSFDKTLQIFDVRAPTPTLKANLHCDIESALWDPIDPQYVIYSTEDGGLAQLDARKFTEQPMFSIQAHQKTTSSVSMSPHIKGMLATTSIDGTIKIWDTNTISEGMPALVAEKQAKAGKLYCGAFYEDSPWLFSCGSSIGEIVVWDTREQANIVNHFKDRVSDPCYAPKQEEDNAAIVEE